MSLTPPKRLFHVPSMSTVMYKDVADDVKEKGYAAVSHVWGDQRMYLANKLGINSGVDWEIPLSDANKIQRIIEAMKHNKMEYCWFDVLCMPQGEDRQWEVNLEIPLMGDYYAGADITLALSTSDYNVSSDFRALCDLIDDCTKGERTLTIDESNWVGSHKSGMIDFSKEQWFKRVWTLQETVLSKKVMMICVDGSYLNLSDTIAMSAALKSMTSIFGHNVFSDFIYELDVLSEFANLDRDKLDMRSVMHLTTTRDCYRPHDRFYGVFGILGYKDFPVDYDMSPKDLNKRIVQYAYSKGDLSWIAAGGNIWPGFVQPIVNHLYMGNVWKEEQPSACEIKFQDDTLSMSVVDFAIVTRCEKIGRSDANPKDVVTWTFHTFKKWGFSEAHATVAMIQHREITYATAQHLAIYLLYLSEDMDTVDIFRAMLLRDIGTLTPEDPIDEIFSAHMRGWTEKSNDMWTYLHPAVTICMGGTIVRASTISGEDIPLVISGDASEGDKIVLTRMCDSDNRVLGFVASESERKGICLYEKMDIPDVLYYSHKFLL